MPGRPPESGVAREQGHTEPLGERDIRRVIRRERASKLPDAAGEGVVGVTRHGQVGEKPDGGVGSRRRKNPSALEPAKRLEDLEVQEMRSVKGRASRKEAREQVGGAGGIEQDVDDDGRVDDDQSRPRRLRISAAPPRNLTEVSPSSRLRISSGVGRSAARRASPSR